MSKSLNIIKPFNQGFLPRLIKSIKVMFIYIKIIPSLGMQHVLTRITVHGSTVHIVYNFKVPCGASIVKYVYSSTVLVLHFNHRRRVVFFFFWGGGRIKHHPVCVLSGRMHRHFYCTI